MDQDAWLSERFGHPVYTCDASTEPDAVARHAAGQRDASYQSRVAAGRVDLVRDLMGVGFYVVSTGLTLVREPGANEGASLAGVREADPGRDSDLLDVAARCFRFSRFHLDPAIPREVAGDIKREWVRSYLEGRRGDRLLVAEAGGRPVGFLAGLSKRGNGGAVRVIDLIGVDPPHQGAGLGRGLVTRYLDEAAGAADLVQVGTQAANEPSLRFYAALGFEPSGAFYDLHMHVSRP